MLITQHLGSEFSAARNASASEGSPYSYLPPNQVKQPVIGNFPLPRRLGRGIGNVGNNSAESSYLTNVEKRAISRYAGRIQYTEPEMMGPLFDPVNWFLPYTFKVLNRWIRYYD